MSTIKFLLAPTGMVFTAGFGFWETLIYSSMGAALGIFVFYNAGEVIFNFFDRINPIKREKKTFSKSRRVMIKLKNDYGIKGLLLVSAVISVPITALLAAKYFRGGSNTVAVLIMGFFVWSIILTSVNCLIKVMLTA